MTNFEKITKDTKTLAKCIASQTSEINCINCPVGDMNLCDGLTCEESINLWLNREMEE